MPMIRNQASRGATSAASSQLTEKAKRQFRYVEKWASVPVIGQGLKNLPLRTAVNTAILLENQLRHMTHLTETQMANAFNATPENILRIVRLSYPNSVRDKIFTEFAMETPRDTIKYIRPIYKTTGLGEPGHAGEQLEKSSYGPNGPNSGFNDPSNVYDAPSFGAMPGDRKATYESAESSFPTETYNISVTEVGGNYYANIPTKIRDLGIVPGYLMVYSTTGQLMGWEARMGGTWPEFTFVAADRLQPNGQPDGKYQINVTYNAAQNRYEITGADANLVRWINIRYNSEPDLLGEFLGNVELALKDYQFKPRPLTLGVSWTYMTELILDTGFKLSAEELLMSSAAQEIKKALDFQAVRFGYWGARTNGMGYVHFDAGAGNGSDDSYIDTAQTVTQIIERVGDRIYNRLLRGGVSRIVGGPAAVTYLTLHQGFSPAGQQDRIGVYQVGTLNGIPVFKAPSTLIPDDELITVWKNDADEADVAVAFGTLVPFFSTGVLQRRNFYKEAGIAHFGDYQILQPLYLGAIKILNIRGLNTVTGASTTQYSP